MLEGYWLVLVTQSNHIPMKFDHAQNAGNFVSTQGRTTCNIKHSIFNDWFTGHTNFHIEHQSVASITMNFFGDIYAKRNASMWFAGW